MKTLKTIMLTMWATLGMWALNAAHAQEPAPTTKTATRSVQAVVSPADAPERTLKFNFQGVSLETVLDYMSETAGFVIHKDIPVNGNVDLVSHQPLNKDEAVAVLNTVLNQKGYAAVRSDRVLTIVSVDQARQRNLPVYSGNILADIPENDEMATWVVPVRYARATELFENLQPLMPEYATITTNNTSNALIITDTNNSVRRAVKIIQAMDQSIVDVAEIRIFELRYADAVETAELITELYELEEQNRGRRGRDNDDPRRQFLAQFGGGGGRGGGRGGENNTSNEPSAARQAGVTVTAVADERTNSVIVTAPTDLVPTIEQLVSRLDRSTEVLTVMKVFPLQFANAEETATLISSIYGDTSTNDQGNNNRGGFFGRGGGRGGNDRGGGGDDEDLSSRAVAAKKVVAVADTRTNSVIVSAAEAVMEQIEPIIADLDNNSAKHKTVEVYRVRHGNPEYISTILAEMFDTTGASGSTNRNTNTNANNRNTRTTRGNTGTGATGGTNRGTTTNRR